MKQAIPEEKRGMWQRHPQTVREKGLRYREIAVIAADMDVYADALEKACSLYDIPVFMDHKRASC